MDRGVAGPEEHAHEIINVGDRLYNAILPAYKLGLKTVLLRRGPWGHIDAHAASADRPDLRVGDAIRRSGRTRPAPLAHRHAAAAPTRLGHGGRVPVESLVPDHVVNPYHPRLPGAVRPIGGAVCSLDRVNRERGGCRRREVSDVWFVGGYDCRAA